MSPRTVLIADDDPVTLQILSAALKKAGYHVITAMDAMQAVRSAHRRVPDAMLLDVMMPGGTGLEVLKKVKASSDTQLIPIIAMSGLPDPDLPGKWKPWVPTPFSPNRCRSES